MREDVRVTEPDPPDPSEARTAVAEPSGNQPAGAEPATAGRTPTGSRAALDRYAARMRRARLVYGAVIGVVVVALGIGVGVAWSRGEISHVSLHTFSPAPSSLGVEAPSATLQAAWRTSDRIAIGTPQSGGTVITYSDHTVGGRDARTGRRTWSYTRSDRPVCTAAQLSNTTIAVYANRGNCDELSAFDSATGRRRWTRTLDKDARPINGRPSYQVMPFTFMVTSDTTIYAIDPVTGLDRWTYYRFGCHLNGAVLGSAGALIGQSCSRHVNCQKIKYCAVGPQVLFRDGSAGNGDDSDNNADKMKWLRRGDGSRPASAGEVITALDPSGTSLEVLGAADGKLARNVPVSGGTSAPASITAAETSVAELVWYAGTTYAIRADQPRPDWTAKSPGPPTVGSISGEQIPNLGSARITVALDGDVALLDGNDGSVTKRFPVSAPAGATVYSLGTGFLVAGDAGIAAYR